MTKSTSKYSVNAVKTFNSPDGGGYSCNLLLDGKKVAEVFDGGFGGGLQFDWIDKTPAKVTVRTYNDKAPLNTYTGRKGEAEFYEYVMGMPKVKSYDETKEMHTSGDIVVEDLLNEFLGKKKLTTLLKKQVFLHLKDKEIIAYKVKANQTIEYVKEEAKKMHKTATILNDLPFDNAYKIFQECEMA